MLRFIAFAAALLGTNVLIHSAGTVLIVRRLGSVENWIRRPMRWYAAPTVLVVTAVTLMCLHLIEMTVWALVYWNLPDLPEFAEFDDALYFSFVTYTTLGYGDVTIEHETWRLLCGLEALNGILLAGWSTALLFLVVQRLWQFDRSRAGRSED